MQSPPVRSSASRPFAASLAFALGLLIGPGCGDNPQRDAGTIDISASKKVAEEKGVTGPGNRGDVRGGRPGLR
ncbi:hypothetical protein ElP_67100 [Tautonia plasticadhaerens]|uniref:Uncharacterized protein n=2 Tax=Tautonia plasticadhaerens TaxID=2527974 RepID=A0A518HD48_9BACT|nr:hypothetical protein ElP_67100 [Tautonia plasticadhaerens]